MQKDREKQQLYEEYVKKLTPTHSLPANMAKAFLVGGLICVSGQAVTEWALAAGMDPQNLKDKFEGQVSFCGGVDTQELLPNGTPEQVAAKVKELRTIFPTGLIISPSHEGLQDDVPPQNIKAMFDEVNKIY